MPDQRPPFLQDKNAKTFIGIVLAIIIIVVVISRFSHSEKEASTKETTTIAEQEATTENAEVPAEAEKVNTEAEKASDSSGSSIHNILISDHADLDGYVEDVKSAIPSSAEKIFATAEISAKKSGNVQATLEMPDNKTMGPNTAEINGTGNILKAFSFQRGKTPWSKGDYSISVLLSTGAQKTVKFKIQ